MIYRYIGGGRWLHGVPARDLDAEEWDALAPALQAVAVERGLYRRAEGPGAGGQEDKDGQQQAAGDELDPSPSPLAPAKGG